VDQTKRNHRWVTALLAGLLLAGCEPEPPIKKAAPIDEETRRQPTRIMVQHCLIACRDSMDSVQRSRDEAKELAASLLERLKNGEEFGPIIKQYTNDSYPGIYKMVNRGVRADGNAGEADRDSMVPAFGDVGFRLQVDEYGMSEFDPVTSKYGWHIIKRLE
jgi:parvulin-like peptidyl-prolyl isomerase